MFSTLLHLAPLFAPHWNDEWSTRRNKAFAPLRHLLHSPLGEVDKVERWSMLAIVPILSRSSFVGGVLNQSSSVLTQTICPAGGREALLFLLKHSSICTAIKRFSSSRTKSMSTTVLGAKP
jgi:hypothetical protein